MLNDDLTYGRLTPEEYDRMVECRKEVRKAETELSTLQGMTEMYPSDFDQQIAQVNRKHRTQKSYCRCGHLCEQAG